MDESSDSSTPLRNSVLMLSFGLVLAVVGFLILGISEPRNYPGYDPVLDFITVLFRVLGVVLLIFGGFGLRRAIRTRRRGRVEPDSSDDE